MDTIARNVSLALRGDPRWSGAYDAELTAWYARAMYGNHLTDEAVAQIVDAVQASLSATGGALKAQQG